MCYLELEQPKQELKMYKPYKSQKCIKAPLFVFHRAIDAPSTESRTR